MTGTLDWAMANSPVMRGLVSPVLERTGLGGMNVVLAGPPDLGTCVLAVALASGGADVTVIAGLPAGAIDEALAARGVRLHRTPLETWAAAPQPDLAIDHGGRIATHLAGRHPAVYAGLAGLVETTPGGSDILRGLDMAFPVFTTCGSDCVRLTQRGQGRRIVQDILRLTNLRMAGTRLAVIGYGTAGRSVAGTAAGLGATVTVHDPDPMAALEAHLDGYGVGDTSELAKADMVIVTEGRPVEMSDLADGCLLAVAGGPLDLAGRGDDESTEVRPGVTALRHAGRTIHSVGPVGGRSIDQADLAGAVDALALDRLVTDPPRPGVHETPAEIDVDVARFALEARR